MAHRFPRTHPEEALRDVGIAIEAHVVLSIEAEAALAEKFYGSAGKYMAEMGALNPTRDIWYEPELRSLQDFVLFIVVEELCRRLVASNPGGEIGQDLLSTHLNAVMRSTNTRKACDLVVIDLNAKLKHNPNKTPICSIVGFVE